MNWRTLTMANPKNKKLRGAQKRKWTIRQLANRWTVEEWLYRLQLVQYKLTERKGISYYGKECVEVTFRRFYYHGFLIAEFAVWNEENVMLTKLNRVRCTFFQIKDPANNGFPCSGITGQQILDLTYWHELDIVFGRDEKSNFPQHWKKGNIGQLLIRTNEAVDKFIRTVHQSMMLAEFHDFDTKKHSYTADLYWSSWKILRDALKRPVWVNHLIRSMEKTSLKDKFYKHYHAWHDRYAVYATMKFEGDPDFDALVKMDEAAVPFIYNIIKDHPDPIVRVLDVIYKGTVTYEGTVPLKDVCSAWVTLLPLCSNVLPRTEKPA